MFIRRFATALRKQDWAAVIIEFVLLVSGVILALHLNNLNQQASEQKLLQNYLTQLTLDLEQDVYRNESTRSKTLYLDEQAEYLLAAILQTSREPLDPSRLVQATLTAGYANLPTTNAITFDELISTGNLRLFKDTELKRAIMQYYDRAQSSEQWNPLIQSVQIDYRRHTRKLLTHEQFAWARQTGLSPPENTIELDIEAYMNKARSDIELPGVIAAMAEVQQRIRETSQHRVSRAKELIEEIAAARK